jgi:hypothetical protein
VDFGGTLITYDGLPIGSGGAHRLRTERPLSVWTQLLTFFSSCTDRSRPDVIEVAVRSDLATIPALKALGKPSRTRRVGDFDEIARPLSVQAVSEWLEGPCRDAGDSGPWVFAYGSFRLVDPRTHIPLPGQDPDLYGHQEAAPDRVLGQSWLYARLARRTTLSVFFSFPFEEPSVQFRTYLAMLQPHLPFRFSNQHWKHWHRRARGTGFVGRKFTLDAA